MAAASARSLSSCSNWSSLKLLAELDQQRLDLIERAVNWLAARRAAAAGLLSSCASPAESTPSADIFSRWRESASVVWMRHDSALNSLLTMTGQTREHLAERLVVEAQKSRRLERAGAGDVRRAAQKRDFAAEAAVVMGVEHLFLPLMILRDLHLAVEDDVEIIGVARPDERRTALARR